MTLTGPIPTNRISTISWKDGVMPPPPSRFASSAVRNAVHSEKLSPTSARMTSRNRRRASRRETIPPNSDAEPSGGMPRQ